MVGGRFSPFVLVAYMCFSCQRGWVEFFGGVVGAGGRLASLACCATSLLPGVVGRGEGCGRVVGLVGVELVDGG